MEGVHSTCWNSRMAFRSSGLVGGGGGGSSIVGVVVVVVVVVDVLSEESIE